MHIVERNGQGKIFIFLGTGFNNVQSDLYILLEHLQVPSSVPCYNPVLPSSRLGDDPYVCRFYSVATVDL